MTRRIKVSFALLILTLTVLVFLLPLPTHAFIINGQPPAELPKIQHGVWHGLLAPYALLGGWLINGNIRMYATPNSGRLYDLGFLIGVCGSVHLGWLAAIISTVGHWTGRY